MIRIGRAPDPANELERAVKRSTERDMVTDEILSETERRARREINQHLRKGKKAQAFNRKNKRRNRGRK